VTTEDKAQDIRFHIEHLGSMAKEIQFIKEPYWKKHCASYWIDCRLSWSSLP
jgi:hypothetical protein